jgi:hypothetical protein
MTAQKNLERSGVSEAGLFAEHGFGADERNSPNYNGHKACNEESAPVVRRDLAGETPDVSGSDRHSQNGAEKSPATGELLAALFDLSHTQTSL